VEFVHLLKLAERRTITKGNTLAHLGKKQVSRYIESSVTQSTVTAFTSETAAAAVVLILPYTVSYSVTMPTVVVVLTVVKSYRCKRITSWWSSLCCCLTMKCLHCDCVALYHSKLRTMST
jgi:hypothetical protein